MVALFCFTSEAELEEGNTSWEEGGLDTGGRLFKSLSRPLDNVEGSLSIDGQIIQTHVRGRTYTSEEMVCGLNNSHTIIELLKSCKFKWRYSSRSIIDFLFLPDCACKE